MKIEAGKHYLTAKGETVGPMEKCGVMDGQPIYCYQWFGHRWREDGTSPITDDIVAEVEPGVWTQWRGGECPVPSDAAVEVMMRLGGPAVRTTLPCAFGWGHNRGGRDIIAYRVVAAPCAALKVGDWARLTEAARGDYLALAIDNPTTERLKRGAPVEALDRSHAKIRGVDRLIPVTALERVEAPWYPDDSGEWVEWYGWANPVPGARVEWLVAHERKARRYKRQVKDSEDISIWNTGSIVAYRVVQAAQPAETPAPADGGWIPWHGRECPVPAGIKIEVTLRCGDTHTSGDPKEFRWNHAGTAGDIIAYRITQPAPTPQPPAPAPYYLVHGLGPTNPRHHDASAARREARRLASKHPGTTFSIMMAVEAVRVDLPEPVVTSYAAAYDPDFDEVDG